VLPRVPAVPGWCFVALAVLGIDAVDWLAHSAITRSWPCGGRMRCITRPAPARPPGDTGQMSEGLVVPALAAGPFRLRPFVLADLDVVREAARDPYIPLITTVPAEFTDTEGRRYIERQWDRARRGSGYSFAIADAATGRAVGSIGLWLHDIGAGRASVGYWVAGPARGRGASRHALRTLTFWALGVLGIPRLELHVEPWNEASIRVAEQAGFRQEGLLRSWQEVGGERKDMLMYSLLRSDLPEA
jgi:RimJ/RimL family protein N-acetyltransferase